MSQDQAAEAVITALLTKENKSRKKRQKRNIGIKPWLKRRKNLEFYETLLADLRLQDEYDYKNYLRMISKNLNALADKTLKKH